MQQRAKGVALLGTASRGNKPAPRGGEGERRPSGGTACRRLPGNDGARVGAGDKIERVGEVQLQHHMVRVSRKVLLRPLEDALARVRCAHPKLQSRAQGGRRGRHRHRQRLGRQLAQHLRHTDGKEAGQVVGVEATGIHHQEDVHAAECGSAWIEPRVQ